MEPLFRRRNVQEYFDQASLKGRAAVEAMPPSVLEGPTLEGALQTIFEQNILEVPRLDSDHKRGARRDMQKGVREFDEERLVNVSVIDVTIPFIGDSSGFHIAPNRCLLGSMGEVGGNAVVVTVPDDDQAQGKVDEFINQTDQNLDTLRRDIEQWKPHFLAELRRAADERMSKLKAARDRDAKLNFPVD
jgi:hypothetical protein